MTFRRDLAPVKLLVYQSHWLYVYDVLIVHEMTLYPNIQLNICLCLTLHTLFLLHTTLSLSPS